MTLNASYLRKLLKYNPDTGVFTWCENRGTAQAGDVAGTYDNHGYIIIKINYKRMRAHRLAWLYVYGRLPLLQIDHINNIKDDNRIINLREATGSQNLYNRPLPKSNTSGYRGVHWSKRGKKWCVTLRVNGHKKYLGLFNNINEAVEAHTKAIIKYHGEFSHDHQNR